MRVLLIGQCTLHWGRMEFGNLGNYAIIEPFVRELHKVFPGAEIRTTFQMSDDFCEREGVMRIPMELYYSWERNDLWKALYEGLASWVRKQLRFGLPTTAYMDEVLHADIIIDFSGDIWGENASFVGKNRFPIGVLKDLTVYWLGKPIALLAGSPGPFETRIGKALARFALERFALITNREPRSTGVLRDLGIAMASVQTTACPAFLFQGCADAEMKDVYSREHLEPSTFPTIGFIICGWNMPIGPYSRWPRDDSEYLAFAETVEHLTTTLGCRVCLLSHNNGFTPPPLFKMIPGRDQQIVNQLMDILTSRGKAKNIFTLTGTYNAAQTKAIIRQFDMLVSGRIHGAVAGMSQSVPTVIIDYGHEPKAHKLRGFAEVVGVSDYVVDPANLCEMIETIDKCWNNRDAIHQYLSDRILMVQALAKRNFELLPDLLQRM